MSNYEIIFETRFNLGDKVWYPEGGNLKKGHVIGLRCDRDDPETTSHISDGKDTIKYKVKDSVKGSQGVESTSTKYENNLLPREE